MFQIKYYSSSVIVYAAYGIYHAENILELCKINDIYIVTKSIKHCLVCKVSDYIKRYFG
jgi:hypothetical protein